MNTLFSPDSAEPSKPSPNASIEDRVLETKALEVHTRLCREYSCPIGYFHDLDPLSELVSSLLSHRTKNADSSRAFKQLKERFSTWENVRDANLEDVQAAISPCTWPEQKAPRVQEVLRDITLRRNGALELSFLAEMSVEEARSWLEVLVGVGPKTSAAVLAFSHLRRRALPVDSHHHRVAQRLGLIPKILSVGPSHRVLETQLPASWNAQQVYDNHEVLMLHGQRVCFYNNLNCKNYALLDLCPTGQQRS